MKISENPENQARAYKGQLDLAYASIVTSMGERMAVVIPKNKISTAPGKCMATSITVLD